MCNVDRFPSVLIADDHAATRRFVTSLLEDTVVQVVGEAANGDEAVRFCAQWHPDIVVLDISMPLLDGFEAARQIGERWPSTKVIFLSGYTLREYVREAFRIGVAGFVSKKHAVNDLPAAIHAAMAGKTYVSEAAARPLSATSSASLLSAWTLVSDADCCS